MSDSAVWVVVVIVAIIVMVIEVEQEIIVVVKNTAIVAGIRKQSCNPSGPPLGPSWKPTHIKPKWNPKGSHLEPGWNPSETNGAGT